jgi:hypothetical protein
MPRDEELEGIAERVLTGNKAKAVDDRAALLAAYEAQEAEIDALKEKLEARPEVPPEASLDALKPHIAEAFKVIANVMPDAETLDRSNVQELRALLNQLRELFLKGPASLASGASADDAVPAEDSGESH